MHQFPSSDVAVHLFKLECIATLCPFLWGGGLGLFVTSLALLYSYN